MLFGWWLAVHLVLGLALLMTNPLAALAGLPLLLVHARRRNPVRGALLVVSDGPRFALPVDGRFNLSLSASSRCGLHWAELVFSDRPRERLLVLRDQLDARDWRRLKLLVRERNQRVCYNFANFSVKDEVYQEDNDRRRRQGPW